MTPRRHTILVVDDEPDVVQSVKDLLRLEHRVIGATSVADAMDVLAREDVHVVMTDQRMPAATGVQLLANVRGQHPDATRLLFTGYADVRAVIEAINQGNVYRYVTKPWDPDELQTIIREACERYDLIVERKQLLGELTEKNEQLQQTNAELRQANELKSAFIQVASHELRTPLTILLGLTNLAARAPNVSGPLRDWLARIERAGERLGHLIDQIITMLSLGNFDRALQRAPTDLPALLNQAADDVRPFVELRRQTLDVQIADELGSADVDAAKVRDAVNHLLLNAIKFTPDEGSITLSASRAPDGTIEIRVGDTGAGIEPASIKRIFEPFFTEFDVSHHSSGQFEYGRRGMGLGLSVVKAFVEMHSGTIDVSSEVGRGTTFTIRIPSGAPGSRA